ncbi:hypothetical protein GNI_113150 [Gregarina niphandrodes]|uniref:Uncharacterized protein n=1 Tax=Gregarina niphandrodes TaxID=110365 RepID=A0A023B3D3_GRENI|nr:hypothetical protein GNI_113150 [Gregarina niphandrodes]EZG55416.1 hypothetical protein GNI_113150 [Gregarina niphandrodes]|eukprot:XP_011131556.1 hypothetical protein GNI_113150 [Gregarina niphandrodes]
MFSSIEKYNGVLAFKKLYCGPSNKHGFGIFTLRQVKSGAIIVSDDCIVFAQDKFRDVDPRLVASLDILHLDLRVYHRRKYSEIFPEWRGCIEQLAAVSRVPVRTLDELTVSEIVTIKLFLQGLLRLDSVEVDVHSNCVDATLSQRELLHRWLEMGEV